MRKRIATLVWKEFLELRRSPQLLRLVIIAPIVQLTVLGYAATTDIHHVPIVIVDGDRSPMSRRLIEQFASSPYFNIVREELSPERVEPDLALGTAWLALVVPAGFGTAVERSRHGIRLGTSGQSAGTEASRIQVIADGTDSNSSGVALSYVQAIIGDLNAEISASDARRAPPLEGRVRVWFNPDLVSRNFMVPGVLAMLLMIVTTNLTSMAIVRERELGTLDQLNVTPIARVELILGKLLPYALVGFVDVLLVVSVAVFWFEVPFRGSFPLLLAASVVYLLCTLGLGLFISTISATQQQAMMTSTFFFLMPMMYLSGFIFPIENMPAMIQPFTLLIPLRYFLVIVRGIFLKGVGWTVLWPQFAALGAWGIVTLTLAAVRSRKTA
jgi:ABC-2 type transport system permease protein